MPEHRKLKAGDRIILTSIPDQDLQNLKMKSGGPGDDMDTVGLLQRLVAAAVPVNISWTDEYGNAWFDVDEGEHHQSLAIMDDQCWVYAPQTAGTMPPQGLALLRSLSGDSSVDQVRYKEGRARFRITDGETDERWEVAIATPRIISEASGETGSVHVDIKAVPLETDGESGLYVAPSDFGKQMKASRRGHLLAVGLRAREFPLFLKLSGYALLLGCPFHPDGVEVRSLG